MRKMLLGLLAVGGLALLAMPAGATSSDVNTLSSGTFQAKFSDYSDLYVAPVTGTNWTPQPFLNGSQMPALGDEDRAIFYTTSIQPLSGPPASWLPGTPPAGQQLTGLFYNLKLAYETESAGILQLYFTQSTRNPLPGTPTNYGGVFETYLSNTSVTPNFTADPKGVGNLTIPAGGATVSSVNASSAVTSGKWGPAQWVQGTGGASRDTYPGASTGSLWLSGTFVDWETLSAYSPLIASELSALQAIPGESTLDPVFSETLDLATGTGSGEGDIKLLGGSFYPQMQLGDVGLGPNVDMTLVTDLSFPIVSGSTLYPSDGSYGGAGYWPVDSQDPVTFNVIPEPATMTLLGLGIAGLLARRRKK